MIKFFVVIFCLALWLTPCDASVPNYDIAAQCLARYGDSGSGAQMLDDCHADELSNRAKLESMSIPDEVLKECDELARAIGGSYTALAECVKMKVQRKRLPAPKTNEDSADTKDGRQELTPKDLSVDIHPSDQTEQPIPDYNITEQCLARYGDSGSGAQMQEDCHAEEQASKARLRVMSIPADVLHGCDELARSIGGSYAALAECVKMKLAKRPVR